MKDRVGCFGDVVFGLLLAGVTAMYSNLFAHVLEHGNLRDLVSLNRIEWVEITPLFEFISVAALWALSARVVTKLFVDHVAFIIGYSMMLYFAFGWAMIEAAIPETIGLSEWKQSWSFIATSPACFISASFGSLLILAIGGLSYHWFQLKAFERYESLRECFSIFTGVVVTWIIGTSPLLISTPVDLVTLVALVLVPRLVFAIRVDRWALKRWGDTDQRNHYARVVLAGQRPPRCVKAQNRSAPSPKRGQVAIERTERVFNQTRSTR